MDKNKINAQVERFKKGFPWLDIVAPATAGNGICVLDEKQQKEAADYFDSAEVAGKCKFVPASGAASRMFKDIFAGMKEDNASSIKLAQNLEKFAFYTPEVFGTEPFEPKATAARLLTEEGLNYGAKPKGVLKFHRYPGEVRTALAEHFVEGQAYMRNADGSVNLVITISPEHKPLFEAALAEIKDEYEARYGVKYNVTFTFQDPETNTVAVDAEGKPFVKDDGSILFRPAGHGALIYNLNELDAELVSIKNIDNVCVERIQPTTYLWKKVLMGKALELRDRIFGYIYALDQIASSEVIPLGYTPILAANLGPQVDVWASDEVQELCNEIEEFLRDELCVEIPEPHDCKDRALSLRAKLDRPIRVCGMVKNEGEPGGGPFIIRAKDGSTSLQILEGAQINPDDPQAVAALKAATHFNPVDLVCCLRDNNGEKFDLLEHVDEETGLISSKSYQGRELKALELPGLWNGSMSDWNTLFVEVPVETFNPVKVVNDLLRPAHQ
ncbi:MAG: DUF4301 family protein [Bacteroidales bacterium]|nr:DUF4301 family protein [Bacteroidales bacterium]